MILHKPPYPKKTFLWINLFSQKQRKQLESDLRQVSDVTGVTMILFINDQGDEHEVYYANAVKGLEPEAEIVSLSAEVAIEVKKYQRGGLIWYELGKRRRRSGGKVKEQGARGGVPDGGQVRAPTFTHPACVSSRLLG